MLISTGTLFFSKFYITPITFHFSICTKSLLLFDRPRISALLWLCSSFPMYFSHLPLIRSSSKINGVLLINSYYIIRFSFLWSKKLLSSLSDSSHFVWKYLSLAFLHLLMISWTIVPMIGVAWTRLGTTVLHFFLYCFDSVVLTHYSLFFSF